MPAVEACAKRGDFARVLLYSYSIILGQYSHRDVPFSSTTTTMRSPSLLPMTWQLNGDGSSSRFNTSEVRRLWDSRRVRLFLLAAAAVCVLLFFLSGPNTPPPRPPHSNLPSSDFEYSHLPRPPSQAPDDPVWYERAEKVKAAFVRGYSAYERIAYPHDELRPLTNGTKDE